MVLSLTTWLCLQLMRPLCLLVLRLRLSLSLCRLNLLLLFLLLLCMVFQLHRRRRPVRRSGTWAFTIGSPPRRSAGSTRFTYVPLQHVALTAAPARTRRVGTCVA